MESKYVILPYGFGKIVAEELRSKYGINSSSNTRFLREDLSKIKALKVENPEKGALVGIENLPELQELRIVNPNEGDLVGIEKLPKLKTLHIESTGLNEFIHPDERKSIAGSDVMSIEKCVNLETLSIVNQPNMADIDLGHMQKLSDLNMNNNMNLYSIYGLDQLKSLSFLTCYGNKSLQNIEGLDKAIIQNKEKLQELNLDVLLFPKAIKYNHATGSYNQEALGALDYINGGAACLSSVKWCENISNHTATKITHPNMLKMHNKACQILSDVCKKTASVPDTVVAVERYLAQNVSYDWDSFSNGTHTKYGSPDQNGISIRMGQKYGANGAYECLMDGCCVCEGYTRGEQYLLALKGIKTRNVLCIGIEDTMGMADHTKKNDSPSDYQLPKDGYHSVICIEDYYNLYSDPCWNACCYQQGDQTLSYSLLTKEEISKDHTLSFEERRVERHQQTVSRSEIEKSIEHNTLFRNARASEANAQRAVLGQKVIGIVRGADGRAY